MSAGYRSYEAFWIGGLSAPGFVPPIPPTSIAPPRVPYTSGDGRATRLDHEWKSDRDRFEEQILAEENEIIAVIIALTSCF